MMTAREFRRTPNEFGIIQNPALGAYALWQFGLGFQAEESRAPVLPLSFLVLPLLLHRPTLDKISSTRKRSGLSVFAAKLGEERENLIAVHDRALMLRGLTLQSLAFAVNAGLITVKYDEATARSNSLHARLKSPLVPERIRGFSGAADKLGAWFSRAGLSQVASTLRVAY
jgi:hypothetical protein